MNIVVIGGGITGRLVQFAIPDAQVYDWGQEPASRLTREWGANYLWEPIPGIASRAFSVVTHIDGREAEPESVRLYKQAIGKGYESHSDDAVRQLMAEQFPSKMIGYEFTEPIPATIQYGWRAIEVNPTSSKVIWANGVITHYDVLISTIPLYALLSLMEGHVLGQALRWPAGPPLRSDPIFVKVVPRPPDALYPAEVLYVNYLTKPGGPYRYCDRGGERHYEALNNMGGIPNKKLVPGKIHDIAPAQLSHIRERLAERKIYCVGRYGAWRSNELLHQTFKHILSLRDELCR